MTDRELDELLTLRWPMVMRRVMADGGDEMERQLRYWRERLSSLAVLELPLDLARRKASWASALRPNASSDMPMPSSQTPLLGRRRNARSKKSTASACFFCRCSNPA